MSARSRLDPREARDLAPYLPFALFVLAPLLVFPRAMLRAGMMDGGDDKLSNLPLLLHSARKLLAGEIFWTSDLWMGMPLLGEPESGTLYLPRLILLGFAPATGYALYVYLHYVLAQIALYLYARLLGLGRPAAAFGALAYAFTGFMIGHQGHTMYVVAGAWAPLFLFFLQRETLGRGRTVANALGALLAFSSCFFCGAVQLSVYLLELAGILHLALAVTTRSRRPLVVYAWFVLPSLLVIAPQLLASWDYAQTLAGAPRADYAFSTELSWDPRLFPFVFLPLGPHASAELYTRIGVVVSATAVFAAVALGGRSGARAPLVRAWTVVALVAIVLMLGRFVPPVAHVLHALPIVSVLRGPVRHNFELGLAVSVLAAMGAEALVKVPPRSDRRAAIAMAVALSAAAILFFGVRARRIPFSIPALFHDIPAQLLRTALVETLLAAGAWFAIRRLARGSRASWVPMALLVAALFESTAAAQADAGYWKGIVRPGVPHERVAKGWARVLPPHILDGGYPTLPGNAVLYLHDVQSLTGYSSIAPRDAVVMFDLDMHGHARHQDDLLWSRLPAVFGVTHVFMPLVSCRTEPFAIDAATAIDAACVHGVSQPFQLGHEEKRCAATLGEERRRYRIELETRALGQATKPLVYGLWSPEQENHHVEAAVPPAALSHVFTPHGFDADLSGIRSHLGWLGCYTDDTQPVEVRALRLTSAMLVPQIDLTGEPTPKATSHGDVVRSADRLTLGAGGGVDMRTNLPAGEPQTLRLEVIARRRDGAPNLVLDLYAEPDFDPEAAQIATGDALGAEARMFSADFRLDASHPPNLSLRLFAQGSGHVDVLRARLLVERRGSAFELTSKETLRGQQFWANGALIHLDAGGGVGAPLELPVRPVLIEAELATKVPNDGVVGIGVATGPEQFSDANETTFPAGAIAGTRTLRRAVQLRADAAQAFLRVYNEGSTPIEVRSLVARDACAVAHYAPLRAIDGGFWLHEDLDAMPRAFTVGRTLSVASVEQARDVLRTSPTFDPRETALVEGAVADLLRRGRVDDARFSAERIELWVEADSGPTFLVVNERFDVHFQATIDGKPAPILRTNGLVRGLVVPRGKHHVVLAYRVPALFFAACGAALAGLLFAVLALPRLSRGGVVEGRPVDPPLP